MGIDFSVWHAGACLACLPLGSSLLARIDKKAILSQSDILLWNIRNMLTDTEHQVPYPWEEIKSENEPFGDVEAIERDDFEKWYRNTQFMAKG